MGAAIPVYRLPSTFKLQVSLESESESAADSERAGGRLIAGMGISTGTGTDIDVCVRPYLCAVHRRVHVYSLSARVCSGPVMFVLVLVYLCQRSCSCSRCLRAPTVTLKQYQPPTCAATTPDVSYLTHSALSTQNSKLKTSTQTSRSQWHHPALSTHPGPPEHSTHQIHSHRPRQRGLPIPHTNPPIPSLSPSPSPSPIPTS